MTAIKCRIAGRFKPIYVFGDSHCLPLRDTCLTVGEAGDQYIINTHFVGGFRNRFLESRFGNFPAPLMSVLRAFELVDKDDRPVWKAASANAINVAFAAGRPMHTPILVMSCGDIDLRKRVCREIGEEYDILVPDENAPRSGRKLISITDAKKLILPHVSNIVPAIRALHKAGFPQSHLLMITPPSMDDETFQAMHGYRCPKAVRAKIVAITNSLLKEECAKAKVGFVDCSAEIASSSGELLPEYFLDGIHASNEATAPFVSALFAQVFESRSKQANATLYRLVERQCAKPHAQHAARFREAAEAFTRSGVCAVKVPEEFVSKLTAGLKFDQGIGNRHVDIDWMGNSAKAFSPHMVSATPSEEQLKSVYDLFFEQGYAGLFQAALGKDVHIINCRPLQSIPHEGQGVGPQSYHHDGCPPGLYRALIYLTDVDEDTGAFEYQDANGKPVKAIGPAGTMLFFDANRLLHRGSPPRKGKRQVIDLCVTVRPERMPPRVMWAGMNNWPKDPFNYSVRNMRAWPPLKTDRIVMHPLPEGLEASEAKTHVLAAAQQEREKKRSRAVLQSVSRLIGWRERLVRAQK